MRVTRAFGEDVPQAGCQLLRREQLGGGQATAETDHGWQRGDGEQLANLGTSRGSSAAVHEASAGYLLRCKRLLAKYLACRGLTTAIQ